MKRQPQITSTLGNPPWKRETGAPPCDQVRGRGGSQGAGR